jgi:uncharacterized phage protein (TIGR01671 family)
MREILFRGKRTDTGEWVEGYYEFGYDSETETPTHYMWVLNHTEKYGEIFTVIPETVGQFTGLTDRYGKRIFEGDIIKHHKELWGEDVSEVGVVFWNASTCMFLRTSNKTIEKPQIWQYTADHYEVIGNIHDTPELLKE